MVHEEVMAYIEALVSARCLQVSGGEYPTVSVTEFGNNVMLEKDKVELALPTNDLSLQPDEPPPTQTVLASYQLYKRGLNSREIAKHRKCTVQTVEEHLQKCLDAGLDVDLGHFVNLHEKVLIEAAIKTHGVSRLKLLRAALPANITYPMIRFVIADTRRRLREQAGSGSQSK